MKASILIGIFILLAGCGETNSDGSDKTTYSSCSIVSSEALSTMDRARDINQCWDGVNYEEKSLAMDWCRKKVYTYLSRYSQSPEVKYEVKSTNCPISANHDTSEIINYSIKITIEQRKSNGDNWDAFGGKPDINIYIDDKYKGLCKDSFECKVNHSSSQDILYFKIYDKDVSSDDFIAQGACQINDTCQLGQALVKIESI